MYGGLGILPQTRHQTIEPRRFHFDFTSLTIPHPHHPLNQRRKRKRRRIPPDDVTHVILDEKVTEIDSRSLEGLVSLITVECVGDGQQSLLQTIGESAFEDCIFLRNVIGLPPSLDSIQKNAFLLCESLTEVTLPPRLRIIEEGAFASCSSLESMTIPASVERIGHCAFASCTSLSHLAFLQTNSNGSRLTHIGDRAFSCCSSLTTVELPFTVQFLGTSAYELCHMLTTVQIRFCKRLKHVEEFTFAWCKRLATLHLPCTLQKIHRGALKGCSSLVDVELPPQLQSIGSEAFYDSSLRTLRVPSSVTSIGASAFQHCYKLGEVEFQDGLKEIGNWSFANCRALRAVFLPSSLEFVGDGAFRDCCNMLGVEVPQNAQMKFGQYVFQRCKSLYSISMDGGGISNKFFPGSTFAGCHRLKIVSNDEHQDEENRRVMLMDATTLSPANKAVYFSRGVTIQRLDSQLAEWSSFHDATTSPSITPFHVLVASPELRHDVFLALLEKTESLSILSCKDIWDKTMIVHLLETTTNSITPKIVSFLKLVIQKTVMDRIHLWGLPSQQSEIHSRVDAIDWDDETSLRDDIEATYRDMGWYERQESLSVLELALWKAKRGGARNDGENNSEEERMICGSSIAIPFVMSYLWKAGSVPLPSIAFACDALNHH